MNLGNIIGQPLAGFTIAGYALFALVTGIAHAESKINVFPNPNVSYQMPLDESPKEQALYLYEILKEHDYSKLEVQLRRYVPELRKIDEEDIEPLDDIVTLALTATNPEVREAFDLMIEGGRRGWGSFNTELQILFWLAEQDEFKIDDTLAQAIAMVNGLWVTMGTGEVREAVRKDMSELLSFLREAGEWQKENFDYDLEEYPLEALVCLAWTGNYSSSGGRVYPLRSLRTLDLEAYNWNTVSLETLGKMRGLMIENWLNWRIDRTVRDIEDYFYLGPGASKHWRYVSEASGHAVIIVDGKKVGNHDLNNADYLFKEYLEKGIVTGECGDEAILIEAFLKSAGIPATFVIRQAASEKKILDSHMYLLYYEPSNKVWKANEKQLNISIDLPHQYNLYIARPPTIQRGYLRYWLESKHKVVWYGNMYYIIEKLGISEIRNMFLEGVRTKEMKKWLLAK